MARIAIITGATGGIGSEFVKALQADSAIDEIWATGRNKDKLAALAAECPKLVPLEADFTDGGIEVIRRKIEAAGPDIQLLVNNAGAASLGPFEHISVTDAEMICRVNCEAPAALIAVSLPAMREGARIINISSASSFQPNPYLSMYAASKVFLKNLSRALSVELKDRGITVTCVCPGWVDTGMLPREKDGKPIRYTGMVSAQKVVSQALTDSRQGKDLSLPGFFAKFFRIYSKIMPERTVMRQWTNIIRKYV